MERERPVGVVILSVIEVVLAVLLILGGLGKDIPLVSGGLLSLNDTEAGRITILVFAAAVLLAAVGMFLGWRWGWALAMILTGVLLVFGLVAYWQGQFHAIRLTFGVAVAFYLNQRAVRDYFEDRRASIIPPPP
jgi:hypothetical protein